MRHILIVDDKVPDNSFGAGFPRAYQLLLSLVKLGHKVSFFPTNRQSTTNLNIEALEKFNIYITDNIKELKDIDVAIMSRPHNVHYNIESIKTYHPNAKLIYDTEALWFRRYDLQLKVTGKLPWWAYRYDELGLAKSVDMCFVVNNEEKTILENNGAKKVIRLAHALDVRDSGNSFNNRKDYLVVGGILEQDSSNEDALWWYLENCWESVYKGRNLNITGHKHTERLLNNDFHNINLLGLVGDLMPLYNSHRVFVASTRFATGIPWKVHEAMANGCPCIISELLANQLKIIWDEEAMVARNKDEFIEKSIKLYEDRDLWEKIRKGGFNVIRRDCDPNNFKQILQASLDELF